MPATAAGKKAFDESKVRRAKGKFTFKPDAAKPAPKPKSAKTPAAAPAKAKPVKAPAPKQPKAPPAPGATVAGKAAALTGTTPVNEAKVAAHEAKWADPAQRADAKQAAARTFDLPHTPPGLKFSPEEHARADAAWQKIKAWSPLERSHHESDEAHAAFMDDYKRALDQWSGQAAAWKRQAEKTYHHNPERYVAFSLMGSAREQAKHAAESDSWADREHFAKEAHAAFEVAKSYGAKDGNPLAAVGLASHFAARGLDLVHRNQVSDWVRDSGSFGAMGLHAVLQHNLGVAGSYPSTDRPRTDFAAEAGMAGTEGHRLYQYAREHYLIHQAALRDIGITGKVTLYRGTAVEGASELNEGSKVTAKARPASSWTTEQDATRTFANQAGRNGAILKAEIPVERLYTSHHLFSDASGEREHVVLGAQDFEATVYETPGYEY